MKRSHRQTEAVLRISNVSVRYGKRDILVSACLDLYPGEIVTLLGPNGCGKSTLLKSIAGIVPCDSGKVFLHSADMTNESLHSRIARGLGFLMQGGAVFPSLSVTENLLIAASETGFRQKTRKLGLAWETFPDLKSIASRRAGLLSGGERQTLALAMILVQGANVWLLDEPSAGLALEGVIKIMELVRHVNRLHGTTILMVEQNLRMALRVAHRACFVCKRSIVETNPREMNEPGRLGYI